MSTSRTKTVTTTATLLVSDGGGGGGLVVDQTGQSATRTYTILTNTSAARTIAFLHASIPLPTLPPSVTSITLDSVTVTSYTSYTKSSNIGVNTAWYGTATVYNGDTAKGSASQLANGSASSISLSVGDWTQSELLDGTARVYYACSGDFSNTSSSSGTITINLYLGTITATWTYTYELPLLGNVISFGGGKAVIGGAVSSNISGTTYQTMGSTSMTSIAQADESMFTFSDGVFSCVKPGNYTVYFYGRGAYNSSGTARYMYYKMFKNGTVVKSVTSGTSIGTGGYTTTYTADFAKDDTFYIQGAVNSGSLAMSGGYIISLN